MEKQTINFSAFNEQEAREILGIKEDLKGALLEEWESRAASMVITAEEAKTLNRLHGKLKLYVRNWNEEDLKIKFIGHLIELVNFDDYENEITAFAERSLSWTIQNVEIRGNVDLMVATGISEPRHPFFFIHEYKREGNSPGSPVGQLLSTMFVAKELNKKPKNFTLFETKQRDFSDKPMYGVYVLGRMWVFVVLDEHKYLLSKSYDSTDLEDLFEIFKLLKAQKEIILEVMREV
jgi:hypothetical protein